MIGIESHEAAKAVMLMRQATSRSAVCFQAAMNSNF